MLRRRFNLVYSVCCEQGDIRESNQDCTLALSGEMSGHTAGLFLVADGCGGMAYGEKISHMLADSFGVVWQKALPQLLTSAPLTEQQVFAFLIAWTQQINSLAYNFGLEVQAKVGSTLTLLLILDKTYYILNVGDSRVYLYRKGELLQLSEDQSLVADMLRNQEILPEEAEQYGHRNVLTMCVGYFEDLQSFCKSGKVKREDIFLLCSDGLYGAVGVDKLELNMPERLDSAAAKRLRELIPVGKAHDNVSVLLVQAL